MKRPERVLQRAVALFSFMLALMPLGYVQAIGREYSEFDSFVAAKGGVAALAFAPSGNSVAIGGHDGEITLRVVQEKKTIQSLRGHRGAVRALAFSPDGSLLVSGGEDGSVRLWYLAEQGRVVPLGSHKGSVNSVAFAPDGGLVATAGGDQVINVWSPKTAKGLYSFQRKNKGVKLVFFRSRDLLVSVGEDREITEWNTSTQRVVRSWSDAAPFVTGAAVSPGLEWLILGNESMAQPKGSTIRPDVARPSDVLRQNALTIYKLESASVAKNFDLGTGQLTALSVSADNSFVLAGQKGINRSKLTVWDLKFGEQVAVLQPETKDDVTSALFSPNGSWLVSSFESGRVQVWKTGGIVPSGSGGVINREGEPVILTSGEPLLLFRQPTEIAVFDLAPLGLDAAIAGAASEQIRFLIQTTPNMQMVERERLEQVMKEQDLKGSGRTDPVAAARIGKILNVRKMILGSMARFGKNLQVTVRLVDVETAAVDGIRQILCNSCTDDDLTKTVAALRGALVPDPATAPTQPTSTEPTVKISYPSAGDSAETDQIQLKGVVNDLVGLSTVTVEISNQVTRDLTLASNDTPREQPKKLNVPRGARSFELDVPLTLSPGSNVITVTATNSDGLSAQLSRVVQRSTSALSGLRPIGKKWAFIVGVSDYEDKRVKSLRFAHLDAASMRAFLVSPSGGGYNPDNIVFLVNKDATWEGIRRRLRDFARKPEPDDLVFFYFASHATLDPVQPTNVYLVTYNTRIDELTSTSLSVGELELALRENLRSQRVVMVVDTCHSSAFGIVVTRDVASPGDSVYAAFNEAIKRSKPGAFVLASALGNELSQEGEKWGGGHGVFTYYLLEALKGAGDADHDGTVTAEEVFRYVYEEVSHDTDGHQHPTSLSSKYDSKLPLAVNRTQ